MSAPVAPNLARIPAGEFLMGAADAEEDERPVHRVYVSEFHMGRFPVTHDEYARFVRATGYPAPAIHGMPLIAGSGRDDLFREMAASYVWPHANRPWRVVGERRRVDAALRVSAQGPARYVRLQRRLPHRVRRVVG